MSLEGHIPDHKPPGARGWGRNRSRAEEAREEYDLVGSFTQEGETEAGRLG